jgi:hypothetical protein
MKMTKNKLADLNDHLFAELERLGDESMSEDQLESELRRAREISKTAQAIIANGNLVLRAAEFEDQKMNLNVDLPKMLEG